MRKVYRIVGESNTRPENLPAGFQVMESEDYFIANVASGLSDDGYHLSLEEEISGGLTVSLIDAEDHNYGSMAISKDAARQLREVLAEYLGEPKSSRVIEDCADDLWFEVAPGRFVSPVARTWDKAEELYRTSGGENWYSLEDIRGCWGPVLDVTADYPCP